MASSVLELGYAIPSDDRANTSAWILVGALIVSVLVLRVLIKRLVMIFIDMSLFLEEISFCKNKTTANGEAVGIKGRIPEVVEIIPFAGDDPRCIVRYRLDGKKQMYAMVAKKSAFNEKKKKQAFPFYAMLVESPWKTVEYLANSDIIEATLTAKIHTNSVYTTLSINVTKYVAEFAGPHLDFHLGLKVSSEMVGKDWAWVDVFRAEHLARMLENADGQLVSDNPNRVDVYEFVELSILQSGGERRVITKFAEPQDCGVAMAFVLTPQNTVMFVDDETLVSKKVSLTDIAGISGGFDFDSGFEEIDCAELAPKKHIYSAFVRNESIVIFFAPLNERCNVFVLKVDVHYTEGGRIVLPYISVIEEIIRQTEILPENKEQDDRHTTQMYIHNAGENIYISDIIRQYFHAQSLLGDVPDEIRVTLAGDAQHDLVVVQRRLSVDDVLTTLFGWNDGVDDYRDAVLKFFEKNEGSGTTRKKLELIRELVRGNRTYDESKESCYFIKTNNVEWVDPRFMYFSNESKGVTEFNLYYPGQGERGGVSSAGEQVN